MSRRVVRYEGEGRLRRPVYEDEGPASAAGRGHEPGSGRAAMARLGALATDRLIPTGGAGPIERRLVTDAQRAATRAVTEGERPPMGSAAHLLADPPVTPPEETPMESLASVLERAELPIDVSRTEARIHALEELQSAALEAQEAIQEHQAAETAMAKAEEVHELALRRLSRAQHHVRELLEPQAVVTDALSREIAAVTHDRITVEEATGIFERLMDASEAEPESSTADPHADWTAGGGELVDDAPETSRGTRSAATPGAQLSPNQARVIEALTAAGGDFADAAAALGTSIQSVSTALRHIGEKGGIPIELIPLLPAAFAKYKPAGL